MEMYAILLRVLFLNICVLLVKCQELPKKNATNSLNGKVVCGHGSFRSSLGLCIQRVTSTGTWESAWNRCVSDNSFLPVYSTSNQNESEELWDYISKTIPDGVQLTWLGMRRERESGLFQWLEPFPKVFRLWDPLEEYPQSLKWTTKEPVYDCVALNMSNGKLVTRPCDSVRLPYKCFGRGHPSKLFKSPFCSNDSLFSHVTRKCVHLLPGLATFAEAKALCENLGARLQKVGDLVDVGEEICQESNDYGWLDKDNENCKSLNLCYDVEELYVTEGYAKTADCSKKLRVICISEASTGGVTMEIEPREFPPFKMKELKSKSLWCDLRHNGDPVPVSYASSVGFYWIKNGRMLRRSNTITSRGRNQILSPILASELIENGNRTSLQGNYQCKAYLPELPTPLVSSSVDFYFSDVSTYLLTINNVDIPYHPVNDDRSNNSPVYDEIKYKMEGILYTEEFRNIIPVEVLWDVLDISMIGELKVLRVHIFLIWTDGSRTKDEENDVYKPLLQAIMNSSGIKETEKIFLRNIDVCFAEIDNTAEQLVWKQSFNTRNAMPSPPCLTSNNSFVSRQCLANFISGAKWGHVQGKCVNKSTEVSRKMYNLYAAAASRENVSALAKELDNLTSNSVRELQPLDLWYAAETLQRISFASGLDETNVRHVVKTVNTMLEVNSSTIDIARFGPFNATSRITSAMETVISKATFVDSLTVEFSHISVNSYNLLPTQEVLPLGVAQMSTSEKTVLNGTLKSLYRTDYDSDTLSKADVAILLPQNLVEERVRSKSLHTKTNFIVYKRGSLYANTSTLKRDELHVVAGLIISASISGEPVSNVDPPVQIAFKTLEGYHSDRSETVRCAFWDQSLNGGFGDWSEDGCILSHRMCDRYICHCSHLTTFSILIAYSHSHKVLPKSHGKALSIITYIGCGLSILGLVLTLATFALFRKWRQGLGHQTVCNLSIALLGSLVVFLLGIDNVQWKIWCALMAALLHYFLLASFAWMMVEAWLQYLRFVKVVGTYVPRFMRKAIMCGWGIPFVIIVISLAIDYRMYGNFNSHCWISDKLLYFAFLLPAGTVMLTNIIMFCVIIYSITWGRQKNLRSNQSEYKLAIARIRAALCILTLLGLSWTFGFFAIEEASLVFQYLFCITTTLQGFLIFIFHVVQDPSTRALWFQLFNKEQMNQTLTYNSNNTHTSRVASIISKPQYSNSK